MSQRTQKLRKHLYILTNIINQQSWTADDVDKMHHSISKALTIANEIHKDETYTVENYCNELQKQEDEAREYFANISAPEYEQEFIFNSGVNLDLRGNIIP